MLANLQWDCWNSTNPAIVLVVKRKVYFKNFVYITFFQKKLFIANFLKILLKYCKHKTMHKTKLLNKVCKA